MDINQINKATGYSNNTKIDKEVRFLLSALLLERKQLLTALTSVRMVSDSTLQVQNKWRPG